MPPFPDPLPTARQSPGQPAAERPPREIHRVGVQYRLDHLGAAVVVDDVKSARGVRRVGSHSPKRPT